MIYYDMWRGELVIDIVNYIINMRDNANHVNVVLEIKAPKDIKHVAIFARNNYPTFTLQKIREGELKTYPINVNFTEGET